MVRKKPLQKKDFEFEKKIPSSVLRELLKSHHRAIQRLVRLFYFSKDRPERMSIKYDETQPDKILVVRDGQWKVYDRDYIIESVIIDMWSQLYDCFLSVQDDDGFKRSLACEETYQRIENFMDDFRDFCERGSNVAWNDQKRLVFSDIVFLSKKHRL